FQCKATITVPPTQRLVIEFVTGNCELNPGIQIAFVDLSTVVGGGSPVSHTLNAQPTQTSNSIISQQVRIYADPSSTIGFLALSGAGTNTGAVCDFSVSGQAVAVP